MIRGQPIIQATSPRAPKRDVSPYADAASVRGMGFGT